jgi:anhydro-N-acetylmuramic acid kinase
MEKGIKKLYEVSKKDSRLIIGLMSGTSLDGLDVALCVISGNGLNTQLELIAFETFAYNQKIKQKLKQLSFKVQNNLEDICLMNKELACLHAQMINLFLANHHVSYEEVDLIASHGQTIFHSPQKLRSQDDIGNATFQIGDGDQIAVETKIITLSDFRQKNVAEGKEGAPLVMYGDYLLYQSTQENRILLNIGGIANFTLLPMNGTFEDIISTDTGPGNTLMDQFIYQQDANKFYDQNAEIALKGTINDELLNALLEHSFFKQPYPKSTGPELFNLKYLNKALENSETLNLATEDIMATLNWFTAYTIAQAIKNCTDKSLDYKLYFSGGGIHNPLLIKNLQRLLPNFKLNNFSQIGFNPDAKEAALFAILANETIAGNYAVFSKNTLSMGKISLPD